MDKIIKRIYELMHSPIITPYNLLENAKLDNYNYVNYYKGEMGLIVEMECSMSDGVCTTFYYHFDVNDKLRQICKDVQGQKEIVFDRKEELADVRRTYVRRRIESINSKAI